MSFLDSAGQLFDKTMQIIDRGFNATRGGGNYMQEEPETPPEIPQEDPMKCKFASVIIGTTTGKFQRRGNHNGVDGGQDVILKDNDLCQNICAIGGIGSGKTTRVINPILYQLVRQDSEEYGKLGGLIFDIKGDFCEDAEVICKEADRKLIKIGVGKGCVKTNLLKGLSPEQAAGFLKAVFYLTGGGAGGDSFWVNQSVTCIQNTLGLLSCLGDEYYTLGKCYEYIFDSHGSQEGGPFKEDVDEKVADLPFTDKAYAVGTIKQRQLATCQHYFTHVFNHMPDQTRESVKATISNILSAFQQPELVDAFSSPDDNYEIVNILNGDLVAVDMPLAKWQTAGQVVYTLIKLRFFNLLQMKQFDKTLPQHPVFFLCDEYQQIISANKEGLSDLSFWDKSRSAKCIGVISTQSISSFRSAIGDNTVTDTVLANFRQKIFFKTEDAQTLDMISKLTGKVEIERVQINENEGSTVAPITSQSGFWGLIPGSRTSTNQSRAVSHSIVEHDLVDPNLVRQLGTLGSGHTTALGFFDVDGQSADDLLVLIPCFVNKPADQKKALEQGRFLPPTWYPGINAYCEKELTDEELDFLFRQA